MEIIKQKPTYGAFGASFNEKKEVLIVQLNAPDHPHIHDAWNLPGGVIVFGENPQETVVRELQEEIGVTPTILNERPVVRSWIKPDKSSQITILCYLVDIGNQNIKIDNMEIKAFQWLSVDAIDQLKSLPLTKSLIQESFKVYLAEKKL